MVLLAVALSGGLLALAGVLLSNLLQSTPSVAQMPEAGRQIIHGVVILAMLLLHGRSKPA